MALNERILELAVETGWSEDIRYAPRAKEIEKFAELIVRECIDLNKQELAFNAFERLFSRYQEHFGVKE